MPGTGEHRSREQSADGSRLHAGARSAPGRDQGPARPARTRGGGTRRDGGGQRIRPGTVAPDGGGGPAGTRGARGVRGRGRRHRRARGRHGGDGPGAVLRPVPVLGRARRHRAGHGRRSGGQEIPARHLRWHAPRHGRGHRAARGRRAVTCRRRGRRQDRLPRRASRLRARRAYRRPLRRDRARQGTARPVSRRREVGGRRGHTAADDGPHPQDGRRRIQWRRSAAPGHTGGRGLRADRGAAPGGHCARRRAGRRRAADDGAGGRLREDAHSVRADHRLVPGGEAPVRGDGRGRRGRQVGGLLRGRHGGGRAGRERSRDRRLDRAQLLLGGVHPGDGRLHSGPRRHRVHLGAPRAPVLPAREVVGAAIRQPCRAPPRARRAAALVDRESELTSPPGSPARACPCPPGAPAPGRGHAPR